MAFSPDIVAAVLRHMNEDHRDDSVLIARAFSGADVDSAEMIGFDERAGVWRYRADGGEHELRVDWPAGEISERPEIRREVVALYDAACARLGVEPRPH